MRENQHSTLRMQDVATLFAASSIEQLGDVRVVTNEAPQAGTKWFVVREDNELRLLDTLISETALADRLLLALEQDRTADARKWFAYLKPRFPKSETGFFAKIDPFSDSPFVRLTTAPQPDAESLKIAAAIVAVSGSEFEKSLAILETARAASSETNHVQFDRAISWGLLSHERHADALKIIERLEVKFAKKPEVVFRKASCLAKTVGVEQALEYLEPLLAHFPKEPQLQVQAARWASSLGKFERAIELARLARQDFQHGPAALSAIAHALLFHDDVPAEALTAAEQAANLDSRTNPDSLFVLAAVQARTGKPREALESLGQVIDLRHASPDPEGNDWYVIGLVAEEYGLTDYAQRGYRKVPAPTDASLLNTPHALAQRRLQKLTAAP
ncbi:MAG: tetratricopeptide repeat protein [Planctomycetaceae bacterium]